MQASDVNGIMNIFTLKVQVNVTQSKIRRSARYIFAGKERLGCE